MGDAIGPGIGPSGEAMSAWAIGRRSVAYSLGGLAYKGVALLAVPLLARLLTPSQLGLLDMAALTASIIGITAAMGSDQGVAYLEPRARAGAGVWASTLLLIGLASGALLGLVALLSEPLSEILTGDQGNGGLLIAAAFYGGCVALTTTALNAIRLHGTPRGYALASFAIVTVEMTAALTIAWLFAFPVTLMVLAWAGGALAVVVPLLLRVMPRAGRPSGATVRRLAAFGLPLVPAAIAWLVGDAVIRATLAREVNLGALGEYGIGYRIASVIALGATGFAVAWQPYIYSSPSGSVTERATGMLTYLVLGLGTVGAAVTILAPEIITVIAGDGYDAAAAVVAPLVGGAVALGSFLMVAAVTATTGSTRSVAVVAVAGAATQILSAPVLITAYGLPGAGLASLGGYLAAVVFLVAAERRLLAGRAGLTLAIAVAFVLIALALGAAQHASPIWIRAGLSGGILLAGAGMAVTARAIHRRWQ